MYCKPQINPIISEFCTELTGITQEQVDSAETFDKVMDHFKKWLKKNYLGVKYKFAIVTDSPWDMSKFLYSQCHYSDIPFPSWASKWINLRKSFSKFYKQNHTCLKHMLQYLEMPFVGRPHCGLDDAKNIARILLKMIYDGANIQINERLTEIKDNKEKIKIKSSCEQMSRTVEEKESSDNDKIQKFRVSKHLVLLKTFNLNCIPNIL